MSERPHTRSETQENLRQGRPDNLLGPNDLLQRRRRAKSATSSTPSLPYDELIDYEQIPKMDDDNTYSIETRVPEELKKSLEALKELSPSDWFEIQDNVTGVLSILPNTDPTIPQGCGYAHLLCDEATWRTLTGDNTATLPGRPDPGLQPTYPTGTGTAPPDTAAIHRYNASLKEWLRKVEHRKSYDIVHNNLKQFFIKHIPEETSRFKNTLGVIPATLSAKDMIARIEPTIVTDLKKDKDIIRLRSQIASLAFRPMNGGDSYIAEMKLMGEKLRRLGHPMPSGELQAYIKTSFLKCKNYDPNTATAALNRLDAAETIYLGGLPDAAARTAANVDAVKHARWIDYFVKEVKALIPDGPGARGRVNYVTQETVDEVRQDIGTICDNQHELAEQFTAWTEKSKTKDCLTAAEVKKLIDRHLKDFKQNYAPNLQCTPVPSGTTSGPTGEVKMKYDWWCHTHGVNLNHGHKLNSAEYIPCTNPGPNYKPEATISNPMGGNTKRDDKAGKYWIGIPGRRGGRVVNS